MSNPRVFIGSSSEGLAVAEAMFSCMSRETEPTLWTHQIFTPGAYPLEALEKAVRGHSFAILVASPDDEVVKRGLSAAIMRDNLLLEFGLFAGALGRKRVFSVQPREEIHRMVGSAFASGFTKQPPRCKMVSLMQWSGSPPINSARTRCVRRSRRALMICRASLSGKPRDHQFVP